mmetsp:Transcript_21001/g.59922  ORF Transcript_21001/g.59922 Transcript_21001/m.59922 type:complete len:118 (+) Transcript_21001:41-394(+)
MACSHDLPYSYSILSAAGGGADAGAAELLEEGLAADFNTLWHSNARSTVCSDGVLLGAEEDVVDCAGSMPQADVLQGTGGSTLACCCCCCGAESNADSVGINIGNIGIIDVALAAWS